MYSSCPARGREGGGRGEGEGVWSHKLSQSPEKSMKLIALKLLQNSIVEVFYVLWLTVGIWQFTIAR